ncbi:hypothetical protein ODZ83_07825 [Acaricomes phytoseiuli]|uniref:hypothetical protein n=1 Tax=Acaricomes phytoseiuli TaxID=291968 RepID=UPI002221B7C1|nr:hypothetical protein [Acaricomes phytoseiuli]MCW1250088.1 hypothetical protein [Acaricomes phytoseiuli]
MGGLEMINPEIDMAIFFYAVAENLGNRILVSGVDVVVTISKESPKQEAALTFINFLFRKDIIVQFAAV